MQNFVCQNNLRMAGKELRVIYSIRKEKLRFYGSWDIIFQNYVFFNDAHLARHGEAQNKFEEFFKAIY